MENENSIKNIIGKSLDEIRSVIDANTVVGKPITTAVGTVVVPVSRVSIGIATGGLDLPCKGEEKKNFGGGGGTGVTINPIGFLTIYPDGEVEMIPITNEPTSPMEEVVNLIEQVPALIQRIKEAITGEVAEETDEEVAKAEERVAEELKKDLSEVEVPATQSEAEKPANQTNAPATLEEEVEVIEVEVDDPDKVVEEKPLSKREARRLAKAKKQGKKDEA